MEVFKGPHRKKAAFLVAHLGSKSLSLSHSQHNREIEIFFVLYNHTIETLKDFFVNGMFVILNQLDYYCMLISCYTFEKLLILHLRSLIGIEREGQNTNQPTHLWFDSWIPVKPRVGVSTFLLQQPTLIIFLMSAPPFPHAMPNHLSWHACMNKLKIYMPWLFLADLFLCEHMAMCVIRCELHISVFLSIIVINYKKFVVKWNQPLL